MIEIIRINYKKINLKYCNLILKKENKVFQRQETNHRYFLNIKTVKRDWSKK